MGNGARKHIYEPNTPPEAFFTDRVGIDFFAKDRSAERGRVFINDHRVDTGINRQHWGKPTELAEGLARAYPLGQGKISGIEIIEWEDGNVLTILSTCAENHFQFDFWAGLSVPEEDVYEVEVTEAMERNRIA